jgi:hypothetical protein
MNDNNKHIWPDEENQFFKDHVIGKTVIDIKTDKHDYISFLFSDGSAMKMYHSQSCCENVTIDDINGDLNDLIGTPIILAELRTNVNEGGPVDEYDSSYTWSFYTFRAHKGFVDIRWYGTSNGNYSEDVDIEYHPANTEYKNWENTMFDNY